LKDWLPEDDLVHFIVATAERVRLEAFRATPQAGGKPRYHPRLLLALLVYCDDNGAFSSRRIERAASRDIRARFIAASTRPDHGTMSIACTKIDANASTIRSVPYHPPRYCARSRPPTSMH